MSPGRGELAVAARSRAEGGPDAATAPRSCLAEAPRVLGRPSLRNVAGQRRDPPFGGMRRGPLGVQAIRVAPYRTLVARPCSPLLVIVVFRHGKIRRRVGGDHFATGRKGKIESGFLLRRSTRAGRIRRVCITITWVARTIMWSTGKLRRICCGRRRRYGRWRGRTGRSCSAWCGSWSVRLAAILVH